MATKKKASRKGKKLQRRAREPESVALMLAVAIKDGQEAACRRFNIAGRTLRRYKQRVDSGDWPEVADILKNMRTEAFERNADLLTEAYSASLRRVIQLLPDADIGQAIKAAEMCGGLKLTKDALDGEPVGNTGSGSSA